MQQKRATDLRKMRSGTLRWSKDRYGPVEAQVGEGDVHVERASDGDEPDPPQAFRAQRAFDPVGFQVGER